MPGTDVPLGMLDETLFAAAESLQLVHATASGIDALLFPAFRESPIALTGEKGLVGGQLADHAFALLLALTHRLGAAMRMGASAWEARETLRRESVELQGKTMGIVGFGGAGREVAKRAVAFGMQCRAADRDAVPGTPEVALVQATLTLPRMLGWRTCPRSAAL